MLTPDAVRFLIVTMACLLAVGGGVCLVLYCVLARSGQLSEAERRRENKLAAFWLNKDP